MNEYDASTYGERIADVYDAFHPGVDPAAIELLIELASGGPVLELGIGTGRIALPLSARGLKIHGVDASDAMVSRLRGFRTVARHLQPGGSFLIEAFVPDPARFQRDQRIGVRSIDTESHHHGNGAP